MKKRILLIAIVALLVLTATPLVAQVTHTGHTLNIGGMVPLQLDLTLIREDVAQNLQLVGTDDTFNIKIADISISTNNTQGWELWVYSQNATGADPGVDTSRLMNSDEDAISYQLQYTGAGGVTDNITVDGLRIGQAEEADPENLSDSGDLVIHYEQRAAAAANRYPAGYYTDQLALVLRAK